MYKTGRTIKQPHLKQHHLPSIIHPSKQTFRSVGVQVSNPDDTVLDWQAVSKKFAKQLTPMAFQHIYLAKIAYSEYGARYPFQKDILERIIARRLGVSISDLPRVNDAQFETGAEKFISLNHKKNVATVGTQMPLFESNYQYKPETVYEDDFELDDDYEDDFEVDESKESTPVPQE